MDTQVAEMKAPERDAQVRATQTLGTRPLVVLTAEDHRHDFAAGISAAAQAQFEGIWRELQTELAALSSNSVHRTIEGAGHSSFQFDNAYAPLTSAAILEVVEAARLGRPLAQER
jgi:hypothetical protein